MTIETQFALGWREYYAAWRFLKLSSVAIAPEKIAGIAMTLTGVTIWMFGGHGLFAICGIVAGAASMIGLPLLRRAEIRRRWSYEPFHLSTHQVSFSSDGIHYLQDTVESSLPWNFYERMVEREDAFMLVCGDDVFSLIPKRAFASAQQMDDFRALCARKLRKR